MPKLEDCFTLDQFRKYLEFEYLYMPLDRDTIEKIKIDLIEFARLRSLPKVPEILVSEDNKRIIIS